MYKSALIIAVIASSFTAIAVQTIPSASAQGSSDSGRGPSCEAARQEHTPLSTPAYRSSEPDFDQCFVSPTPQNENVCFWPSGDPEERVKRFLNEECAKRTPPSP